MNPVQTHMHAKQKKNGIQISKENCEQSETHTHTKKNHGNHESHGTRENMNNLW